ncbi:hypothetical protein [Parendozoicomonas haliclonae]|uniref:Bacteriophage replication protein O n=1 Tax=Parendozoicomonas haliclonae TaxID=1960125 RepID=A0A1X7AKN3_9GAMM|nr:hypothetical protein [Parendozoicomonas haliclonae]SMA47386.1 hypothetical protein EHSB41UT_02399 [Parendozoicomonas haliclonae]
MNNAVHQQSVREAVLRVLGHSCKNRNIADLVSRLYHWSQTPTVIKRGGFFWKSRSELTEETGLSRYQQEGARTWLKSRGFLVETKQRLWGYCERIWFKLNVDALFAFLGLSVPDEGDGTPAGVEPTQSQSEASNEQSAALPSPAQVPTPTPVKRQAKPKASTKITVNEARMFEAPLVQRTVRNTSESFAIACSGNYGVYHMLSGTQRTASEWHAAFSRHLVNEWRKERNQQAWLTEDAEIDALTDDCCEWLIDGEEWLA